MANIKNNNSRRIDCRLYNDMYMDFMLSKDETTYLSMNDGKDIVKLDFKGYDGNIVISETVWENATASNTILKNIGYTGVDNGFLSYDKDMISNAEFLEIFTGTTFDLSTYGKNFFVTRVSGNSHELIYPIEQANDYVALKGGFYQGFFKIDGSNYQTLPYNIEDSWNFTITLRPRDYEINENTLNHLYNNNSGMFFYIGTRAENKFWEYYNNKIDQTNIEDNVLDYSYFDNSVFDECECSDTCQAIEGDYFASQVKIDDIELKDSKDFSVYEHGFYEIETDNKFIIFNQTKEGFTTKTWNDENKYTLTGKTETNINYYTYLNQTNTGYTSKDINEVNKSNDYDVYGDITNNALGVKTNSDGSITYRYLVFDCDSENNVGVIEETTKSGLIKPNEWSTVRIKLVCISGNKMKILIYVNDFLKLVSKELPLLNLRSLNDLPNRQEGVPYNISIGGGTQGLCERIVADYYNTSEYHLPIEKYFAGTFIGDIQSFEFYGS